MHINARMPDNDVCELFGPINSGVVCWILWSLMLVAIILAALIFWFVGRRYWFRRRLTHQAHLDPYETSMALLENARQLMLEADDVMFASTLTDAIRQYLARTWDMPAPECTTEEFLLFLMPDPRFDGTLKEDLRDLLIHADLAKFARQRWNFEERERRHTQAQSWIQKVHAPRQAQQRGVSL